MWETCTLAVLPLIKQRRADFGVGLAFGEQLKDCEFPFGKIEWTAGSCLLVFWWVGGFVEFDAGAPGQFPDRR